MQKHTNPFTSVETGVKPYRSMASYLALAWIAIAVFLQMSSSLGAEVRLRVRHEHALKDCTGELVFTDQGVEYVVKNGGSMPGLGRIRISNNSG